MRGVLNFFGTLVLVPYIVLAGGFLLLGRAIASGSALSFLGMLLSEIDWLIPWGLLGFVCTIALIIALGFNARLRWLGGLCLFLVAAGCLVVIFVLTSSTVGLSQLLFLLPCVAVMVFGAWLAVAEWRSRRLIVPITRG